MTPIADMQLEVAQRERGREGNGVNSPGNRGMVERRRAGVHSRQSKMAGDKKTGGKAGTPQQGNEEGREEA